VVAVQVLQILVLVHQGMETLAAQYQLMMLMAVVKVFPTLVMVAAAVLAQ
jgi:hypothetical protein